MHNEKFPPSDEVKAGNSSDDEAAKVIAEKVRMLTEQLKQAKAPESWAIAELMGHVALAGRITKPGEYGGLWQIDIPEGDTFRTEFFGSQSVYRIRMVSEEIARAYAPRHEVLEYNVPIITREEHEQAMERARTQYERVQREADELRRRLTAVNALPAGTYTDNSAQISMHFDAQQSSEAVPGVADAIEELWDEDEGDE